MTLADLAGVDDPILRAKQAIELMAEAQRDLDAAQAVRDQAFAQLRYDQGYSVRKLASLFGISKSTIANLTG